MMAMWSGDLVLFKEIVAWRQELPMNQKVSYLRVKAIQSQSNLFNTL